MSAAASKTLEAQRSFGRLLRDRRDAAGLSRVVLAKKAGLSDATIKFTETAVHPPTRVTLVRLLGVPQLGLSWTDVPKCLAKGEAPRLVGDKAEMSLDHALKLSGCKLAADHAIGCRQAREVFGMLGELLVHDADQVQIGAASTLRWLLGQAPAPLLQGFLRDPVDGEAIAHVAWLARVGAAVALHDSALVAWLSGVQRAIAWVLRADAPEPGPAQEARA